MATTRHSSLVEKGERKALLETLHTHQKKSTKKAIFTNLKKRFEQINTPVAGSIFGSLSQTHISKSEFKNEILRSALLDIQVTLLGVCGVDELEYLIHGSRSLFQKEAFEIRFMDSDS